MNQAPIPLEVNHKTTVDEVKEQIKNKLEIDSSKQRLIFAGKVLENDKTLGGYDIQKNSTLHLVVELRGDDNENDNGDSVVLAKFVFFVLFSLMFVIFFARVIVFCFFSCFCCVVESQTTFCVFFSCVCDFFCLCL